MLAAALLFVLADASQPFNYMDQLRNAELAAASDPQPNRAMVSHPLGTARSFVGETELAQAMYARSSATPAPTPEETSAETRRLASMLSEHEPRDAIAAIVEQARARQIVILNEAHGMPRHRAFATLLGLELRKLGFEYLAVETLNGRGEPAALAARVAALRERGYPLVDDGYYSKEPVFGDFLRRSLAAGYRPVAYEFDAYPPGSDAWRSIDRQVLREEGQAQNIVDRVLAGDPKARIFVYVGHGHVSKGLTDFDGRKIALMAESLRIKSGIDPFCIEQSLNAWQKAAERDRPMVDQFFARYSGDSMVLAAKTGGGYWNPGNVDIQVWHRPVMLTNGRPHWLSMDGYRSPRRIPAKLLPREGRRLIQAFVAGESPDAVPMDQVLVSAGKPPPMLMLPKGKYRFAYQD